VVFQNPLEEDVEFNADLSKHAGVRRVKSNDLSRALLGCPVPSEEPVSEEDRNLGDLVLTSDKERAKEVVHGIVLEFEDGYLGSGENNRLVQVLQHEAEGGCSIGHGVRTMEDDEGIEVVVVLLDHVGDLDLVFHGEVAGVEQLVELLDLVEYSLIEGSNRRYTLVVLQILAQRELFVVKIRVDLQTVDEAWLGDVALLGVNHGKGTSCTDYQDSGHLLALHSLSFVLQLLVEHVESEIGRRVSRNSLKLFL